MLETAAESTPSCWGAVMRQEPEPSLARTTSLLPFFLISTFVISSWFSARIFGDGLGAASGVLAEELRLDQYSAPVSAASTRRARNNPRNFMSFCPCIEVKRLVFDRE